METYVEIYVEKEPESQKFFTDFVSICRGDDAGALEHGLAELFGERSEASRQLLTKLFDRLRAQRVVDQYFAIESSEVEADVLRASFISGWEGESFLRVLLALLVGCELSFVRARIVVDEAEGLAGLEEGETLLRWKDESLDNRFVEWWHGGRGSLEGFVRERFPEEELEDAIELEPAELELPSKRQPSAEVQRKIDEIVASSALESEELLGSWTPNVELTTAAFEAQAAKNWAEMPEDLKEFLGGSLEEMVRGSLAMMHKLMSSASLRFTEKEMVRKLGSDSFPRPYVIDSIDDRTLRIRSLRTTFGELDVEVFEVFLLGANLMELRSGKGRKRKTEVYDRVPVVEES